MLELISTTYSRYRTSHQEKLRLTYIRCWQPSLVGHHFTTTDTLFVVCNAGMVVESLVSSGIGGIDCVFFFRRYSFSLHDMVNKRYLSTLALNIQPKMSYVFYNPCAFTGSKIWEKKHYTQPTSTETLVRKGSPISEIHGHDVFVATLFGRLAEWV